MKILVIGGTRFIGRAIVGAALEGGHDVTLFNRGTHRDVFPTVARIVGDRNHAEDVEQIARGDWDCIVDVNAYRPAELRPVLRVLAGRLPHYLYISTVSVYAQPPPGADEDAPLLEVDESISPGDPDAYGGLKVLCERMLRDAAGDRLTVLRPTVVVGPHDYTDRFPWWVRSVARGGRLQVPRRLEQPVQLIDAGDLGAFAVRTLSERVFGTFNTVGPKAPQTLGGMIEMLSTTFGSKVELDPVDPERVSTPFPLTVPEDGSKDGSFMVSSEAARRQGLTLRPLSESAAAVLHHEQERVESR